MPLSSVVALELATRAVEETFSASHLVARHLKCGGSDNHDPQTREYKLDGKAAISTLEWGSHNTSSFLHRQSSAMQLHIHPPE